MSAFRNPPTFLKSLKPTNALLSITNGLPSEQRN